MITYYKSLTIKSSTPFFILTADFFLSLNLPFPAGRTSGQKVGPRSYSLALLGKFKSLLKGSFPQPTPQAL